MLRHISAGLTTQQSAQLLEVSPKTVDNHKQRMFAKLQVQNQAHAVAVAHRAGILRPQQDEVTGAYIEGSVVVLGRRGLTRDVVRYALEDAGVVIVDLVALREDDGGSIVAVLVNPSEDDWEQAQRLTARVIVVNDGFVDTSASVDTSVAARTRWWRATRARPAPGGHRRRRRR